jgi:hypothetical protein
VTQIQSDQCGGACLIPIWDPDPSAEAMADRINHFEIVTPLPDILQEWPLPSWHNVCLKVGQISVVEDV